MISRSSHMLRNNIKSVNRCFSSRLLRRSAFYPILAASGVVGSLSLSSYFSTKASLLSEPHVNTSTSALPLLPVEEQAIRFKDIKIKLYQYEVCPYCNKVRAYVSNHRLSCHNSIQKAVV